MTEHAAITANPAIFLSYARENADVARRIAEALRSRGLEVWFDQNELRGGDAWDQQIRRQIRECTLFIALISAATQARREGYFRREWKLAVERTQDMAAGVAFLLPVVIDATRESGALVPEEFMGVQWMRLTDGLPTVEFVTQVKRQLDGTATPPPTALSPNGAPSATRPSTRTRMLRALAAIALVAACAAGYFIFRPAAPAAVQVQAPVTAKPAAPNSKSIAVLPFANMSDDKDSGFFTDGIHEDILTNLALIKELHVVSRTSVEKYRNSTKSIGEIAQELNVAYILEGSVRRSGNKVRVTGQLIYAGTDEHVWAQAYDRDLTDVFAIQSELAHAITGALQTTLSPEEHVYLTRKPTDNMAAYDHYLKARTVLVRGSLGRRAVLDEATQELKSAVEMDPKFAAAWAQLAENHTLYAFWGLDATPARLREADQAIDRAVQLAPNAPEVIRLIGSYAYYGYRDYARATIQYERLAALQPNDPTVWYSLALIQRRQGRWTESLINARKACALEPANVSFLRNLIHSIGSVHRWDEAVGLQSRLCALLPGDRREEYVLARAQARLANSPAPIENWIASLPPPESDRPFLIMTRSWLAWQKGDYAEFRRLDRLQPAVTELTPSSVEQQAAVAALRYAAIGDVPAARARLGSFPNEMRTRLQAEPNNWQLMQELALVEAVLGHPAEAVRLTDQAVTVMPQQRDAIDGAENLWQRIEVLAWAGEMERALAELARLADQPGQYPPGSVRIEPYFFPLRRDPRFEQILSDPKNLRPLF